jgi:hypothetical protein
MVKLGANPLPRSPSQRERERECVEGGVGEKVWWGRKGERNGDSKYIVVW